MKRLLCFVAAAAAMLWASVAPSNASSVDISCGGSATGCYEAPTTPLAFGGGGGLPASGTFGDNNTPFVLNPGFTDQFQFQLTAPPNAFDSITDQITNGAGTIAGLTLSIFGCTDALCTSSTQIASTTTNTSTTGQSEFVTANGLAPGTYFIQVSSSGTNTAESYTGNIEVNASATPLPSTWTMLIASLLGIGWFAHRGPKMQALGLGRLDAAAAA
jgi:hypothetical protein